MGTRRTPTRPLRAADGRFGVVYSHMVRVREQPSDGVALAQVGGLRHRYLVSTHLLTPSDRAYRSRYGQPIVG